MKGSVARYTKELTRIFREAPDKHEAHRLSAPVLKEMAGDPDALGSILENYLSRPQVLDTLHYPVIGIDIELNAHYGLVANCWIPLGSGRTDVSTKAIHHHGEMLLTTVTAFGPGYEHWTFTRPSLVDAERELFAMEVLEQGPHPREHAAFVDAYIAHVPLYPQSLTITLALWSHRKRTDWRDWLKRLPVLKGKEKTLRELASRLGLAKALELKIVQYFDFYPTVDGFHGMRERKEFELGANADYLCSLFHVLQRTENDRLGAIVEGHVQSGRRFENTALIERLLRELKEGREIQGRLSTGHFDQPNANFTRDEIARALSACGRKSVPV